MQERPTLYQFDGKKLTDRMIRLGLKKSIWASVFGMAWITIVMNMPFQMYLEALGASGFIIGLSTTVNQFSAFFQLLGAIVAERISRRKILVMSVVFFQRLLWFIPALLPWVMPLDSNFIQYAIICVVALSACCGQFVGGPWLSWMTDLVPENIRGAFWGRRQQVSMTASLLTLAFSGWLLDYFKSIDGPTNFVGFSIVFCVAACAGLIDVFFQARVAEPKMVKEDKNEKILKRIAKPLANRDFCFLTVGFGFWLLGLLVVGFISNVYLIRTFDVGYSNIAVIAISATLGIILISPSLGYIIDRLGPRVVTIIAMSVTPCISLVWFFVNDTNISISIPFIAKPFSIAQPVLLLIVSSFFTSAIASGAWLSQLNLLTIYLPPKGRTTALALHYSFMGLIGAFGPFLGGFLVDAIVDNNIAFELPWGTAFSYMQILVLIQIVVIWFVAIPALILVKPRSGEISVGVAASRIFIANPFRLARSMYNVAIMKSSVTSQKKAEAAVTLGIQKYAIAIKDLILNLDDPSFDVREAAIYALGKIGSNDAVEALITKLDDPDVDLAPQLARALRKSKNPRAVDTLLKKLDDPDRETKRETLRTLGAIGDKRATSSLLRILKSTDDNAIVSASSEALARLGEIAAIYDVLPRMHFTNNPVLHRSLAVAIGDLLIPNNDFYLVLTQEQKDPCSQVEKLIKSLQKSIRAIYLKDMISQGSLLIIKCDQFLELYEDHQFQDAAATLFDLAIGISALFYGSIHGGDSTAFINDLIWRDQRFGIGVWYLDLTLQHIRSSADNKNKDLHVDLVIGIYFLANWSKLAIVKI